ncbi:MAG: ADOP family duplicated permease [Gemmatimonadota bacterium]|jgi:predicted permease
MFHRLRARIRALLSANRLDPELDEEMAFHIERLTEDLVRRGMDPREARREARRRFGSVERAKARSREERGLRLLDEAVRNVRFAIRGMARSPVFFGTSVLTLALCIGLGAAVFSVVNAVLWRPLPYPHPDHLAQATLYMPSRGKSPANTAVDGRAWERIRDEGAPLERAVYSGWVRGVNLATDRAAAFVQQQRVGAGYFSVLGVPPVLGREFDAAEDAPDGPPVAILSHDLWARTFGADPDIVGKSIRLKGETHTVVGVMPAGFSSPGSADVWTPLRASRTGEGGGSNYAVLVRFPQGMSLDEADARMASIEPPPSTAEGAPERRFGLVPLDQAWSATVRLPLLILLGAIGLMVVVGCANLAGLQIARSLSRQAEMATRQALGGGTGALGRQIATENLVLGVLGGVLGLGMAYLTLEGLQGIVRTHFSLWQDIGMNAQALGATVGLTVLATLLFGLTPLLRVTRSGASRVLAGGARGVVGGGSHLLRKALLVGQVAMVTALLFAAGLLVRSYGHLQGLDPGFDPGDVLTVQFSLDDARYADAQSVEQLFRESLDALRRIPGVTSAAVALTLPYERPLNLGFSIPDEEQGTSVTNAVYVTPGFFKTLDIPLLRGRTIEDADRQGAPVVAVANQAFVDAYLRGGTALGRRLAMGFAGKGGLEVVGVVGNVQQAAGWGDTSQPVWETPTLYLSAAQLGDSSLQLVHVWFSPSWVVRSRASAAPELPGEVLRVFRSVDPDLPTARVAWLRDIMSEAFARPRFEATFLIAVAAFALLLAGIGLYGIVAHEVVQRRTEMGLRMALGSTPRGAVWAAALPGIRLTLLGLLVGGVVSVAESRVMVSLVWGIVPYDPATLVGLVGVLALLAAVASFLPAARVGRMDPAAILREG